MTHSASTLLDHPEVSVSTPAPSRISNPIEAALFCARGAMLAGWDLSPEEALAYVGKSDLLDRPHPTPLGLDFQEEDEVLETALYFGE